MGSVYKARHVLTKNLSAVKLVLPHVAHGELALQRSSILRPNPELQQRELMSKRRYLQRALRLVRGPTRLLRVRPLTSPIWPKTRPPAAHRMRAPGLTQATPSST
ncbi:MAG: hypothetical protein HY791_14375 [Deltaproteobacteria bacterium]|nr:hypothetical protein [Deltaproteobacteria bacterium]